MPFLLTARVIRTNTERLLPQSLFITIYGINPYYKGPAVNQQCTYCSGVDACLITRGGNSRDTTVENTRHNTASHLPVGC